MKLIKATHIKLQDVMATYSIPSSIKLENVMLNSPLNWSVYQQFTQIYLQSEELFKAQRLAAHSCKKSKDQYLSIEKQSMFIKCRVITVSPGCGKLLLMIYVILDTMSKGMKVGVYAMQSYCVVCLGDFHLHKKIVL